MRILHFMNEVPSAFPAALAEGIDVLSDIDLVVASFFDDVDDEVRDGPLEVVTLGAEGKFDTSAYGRLRRLIRERDVDVFHTHPNATGAMARIVAATTDAKAVDTRHTDHRHFSWYRRLPNHVATPVTDRFISNSKTTKESFSWIETILLRLRGGRHEVVYNGVDPAQMRDLPPEPGSLPDTPRVICVARYVPAKNHETLVKAMSTVLESVPDAKLILVGDGPRYEEVASLIDGMGLRDSVIQLGYLPRKEALSAVTSSDVFAIASHYEGFCLAAVEAMFTNTPVVASDIPVLHEVVGDAGRFAPPDDASQFADRIVELLTDEPERKALGERAGERARSTFSLDQTVDRYVRTYRELMEEYRQ